MIHKYLVVGRRVFFSSTKYDEPQLKAQSIELVLPIDVYWDINKLLTKADYLLTTQEPGVEIQAVYRKIFKTAMPFAKGDADRTLILERLGVTT